jgi:hypothetical protein
VIARHTPLKLVKQPGQHPLHQTTVKLGNTVAYGFLIPINRNGNRAINI